MANAYGGIVLVGFGLVLVVMGCSSIKIHTGPPTDEEATRESADRGRQVRIEWVNRLRDATPPQQAAMIRNLVDSTCANYIRYGYRVTDMWRDESDRRGVEVPIDEIRKMVEVSNQTELPILEAYEEVLEFGVNEVLYARYFDQRMERILTGFRDHYTEVYSTVFYPNGTREDYEFKLQALRAETESLSREFEEELRRFE